jgi:hypothetical protein
VAYQFNPPPGWPTPPQGWSPPEGWEPDASWPTPPQDWQFWVEESAAGSDPTPVAPAAPETSQSQQPDPTQQLPAASFEQSQPSQSQPSQQFGSGSTPPPAYDPTQQIPSQHSGGQQPGGQQSGFGVPGGYSQDPPYQTAPRPYSGEPTAQLPYSTDPAAFGAAPPSYAAGGFGGQGGQGNQGGYPGQQGFGPGGPGGPGDPGKKKNNVGLLVGIIAGAVLILGIGTFAVVNALSGGSDDPTADPTTSTSEPTDDPTTPDPTDDPTTDAPTDDPTTDAPTDDPSTDAPTTAAPDPNAGSGTSPAGTVELGIGAPYEVKDFDDALEATATLQEMVWDPTCNSSFGGDPEGRLLALRFDVTVANPTPDGEAFSMNGLYFNAYSDAASTGSAWSLFCEVDPVLPDDIQPGATVSGWIVVDIPEGSTWVTYEPTFGMGGDSAAWRLPS